MSAEIAVIGVSQEVAAAVRKVYDDCGGDNLVSNLLQAAERGDEALRAYFEWDDKKAAHEYRLVQAENLVRRVRVKLIRAEDSAPVVVRAYIARRELPAKEEASPSGSYVAIEDIAGASDQEAALVASIRRDVQRLQSKYRHVKDFLSIVTDALAAEEESA